MFEIKELEWEKDCNGNLFARFPFDQGKAVISKNLILYLTGPRFAQPWSMPYSYIDQAQKKANDHWRGILKEFLREV